MTYKIHRGDVIDQLAKMTEKSVHCVVTSPPYWGLRDYQVDGQIGLEATPKLFIDKMVGVFRVVKRVLRDDGTCFINLGDVYAHNGPCGGGSPVGDSKMRETDASKQRAMGYRVPQGLKPKDLCGIPWRVALALQADGWYLRQDIIWHKPNPMPESCTDRCTKSHEYLFLLTKKPRYYYDAQAIREPAAYAGQPRGGSTKRYEQNNAGMDNREYATRNKRSVWTINPQGFKGAHFATFPENLVEPCVLAGTSAKGCCPECGSPWERVTETYNTGATQKKADGWDTAPGAHGSIHRDGRSCGDWGQPVMGNKTIVWQPSCGCMEPVKYTDGEYSRDLVEPEPIPCTVLDPFSGSGTTILVANRHGRDAVGIELNQKYIKLAHRRISKGLNPTTYRDESRDHDSELFTTVGNTNHE